MKEQNPGGLSEDFHYFTTSIVSLVTGLSFFKVLNSSL